MEIKGDQEVSRSCTIFHLRVTKKEIPLTKGYSKRVSRPVDEENLDSPLLTKLQLFALQEDPNPRITPTGGEPSVEKVQLKDGKQVSIRRNLSTGTRRELLACLKRNIRVLAWKIEDMPGINLKMACHKLNILPGTKPVWQKRRPCSKAKKKAIAKEIKRLREVGFIKEVKYLIWLTNIVVVPKKNEKMRICIDFRDLNKVYPKDNFPYLKLINWSTRQ